ncbi:MAG TPA: glutathione S-transferase family protein [Kofleriaceae bacterium]|jgi:glutathione S-transferase
MLTVQGFGRVPELVAGLTRDLRVFWACEELGVPYEIEGLDFQKLGAESHSPFAQLPTITDDGFVLTESGAILNYLAEKAGAVADARHRHELNRWSYAALSTIEPAVLVVNLMAFQGLDDAVRANLTKIVERHLGSLDNVLAKHDTLVASGFSVADILLVTVLRQLSGLGIIEKFPHVAAYTKRCEARPIWQRVLDAQEDRLGVPRGAARRTVPERKAFAASQKPS